MVCYFYDDDNDDDFAKCVKKKSVYQGLKVVQCLGIMGSMAICVLDQRGCVAAAAQLTEGIYSGLKEKYCSNTQDPQNNSKYPAKSLLVQ